MSRLFFFIQEAFRALRRNAAPSMAAIVTTVDHRDPARRADPDLPDDAGEERPGARKPRVPRRRLRRRDPGRNHRAGRQAARRSRTSPRSSFITKAEALRELEEDLGKSKSEDLLAQLHDNPLPRQLRRQGRRRRQPRRGARRRHAARPERQAAADLADHPENVFDRQQESPADRAGDERAEDRPDRDHARC